MLNVGSKFQIHSAAYTKHSLQAAISQPEHQLSQRIYEHLLSWASGGWLTRNLCKPPNSASGCLPSHLRMALLRWREGLRGAHSLVCFSGEADASQPRSVGASWPHRSERPWGLLSNGSTGSGYSPGGFSSSPEKGFHCLFWFCSQLREHSVPFKGWVGSGHGHPCMPQTCLFCKICSFIIGKLEDTEKKKMKTKIPSLGQSSLLTFWHKQKFFLQN